MHDIKFRGKRVDNGEWVYGSLVSFGKPYIVTSKHGFSHYRATASKTYMHIKDAHKVIPKTVGQFTGLLDKNSVEIYEGDVICYEDNYIETVDVGIGVNVPVASIIENSIKAVEWFEEFCAWGLSKTHGMLCEYYPNHCVVIGNIHEQEAK